MRMKHIALALALTLAPQLALSAQTKVEDLSGSAQLLERSDQDLFQARRVGGVIGTGVLVESIQLEDHNVAIGNVEPNSPAAKAGLQEGHTVWMVNQRLVDGNTLTRLNEEMLSSDQLSLSIERSDGVRRIYMRASDRNFGLTLVSTGATENWRVKSVAPDSAAEYAGMQVGDVITAVNFRDLREFSDAESVEDFLAGDYIGEHIEVTVRRSDNVVVVSMLVGIVSAPQTTVDLIEVDEPVAASESAAQLSFENLDWSDIVVRLESFRSRLGGYSELVLDLESAEGNDPTLAARIIARFVSEGVVLRHKQAFAAGFIDVVYSVKDGVLSRQVTSSQGTYTDDVERDITVLSMPLTVTVDNHTAGTAEAIAYALKEHSRATIKGGPSAGASQLAQFQDVGKVVVQTHNQELLTFDGGEFLAVAEDAPIHIDPPNLGYGVDATGTRVPTDPVPLARGTASQTDNQGWGVVMLFVGPAAAVLAIVFGLILWLRRREQSSKGGVNLKK